MRTRASRVVLVGGGHSHVEVLRRFALRPEPGVELTLISRSPWAAYSGMLAGHIAGHYSAAEAHVDLAALAQWAGARFIVDAVVALDLYTKTLTLTGGNAEPFDLLAIDTGSTPDMSQVPGATENAIAVRPVPAFLAAWEQLRADAAEGHVGGIAVVGGGATGVELLLAMQHRLAADLGDAAPRFALITGQPQLLPDFPPAVRARLGTLLVARGVVLHQNSAAIAVERGTVITTHHRRIAVDRIFWATSAAAQPWPAASDLVCDARGFILTDRTLRSTSHPFVFATGDCAAVDGPPAPKSAAVAIRQGPPLAANLRRALRREALASWTPPRRVLSFIATGGRHAVAALGPLMVEGDWVWQWKDRLDRAHMAIFALPKPVARAAAAPDEA